LDGGARQLDQPVYWDAIDDMMTILERGLRPPVAADAVAER
jgi:hypothetical protein